MRIGLVSYISENRNTAFNLTQIERAMKESEGKAELLCFSETFLQGFDSLVWDYDTDSKMAVERSSKEITQIREWTKQYDIGIVTGYIEKEDDHIYSSCIVIVGGEIVHNYRRISKGWKEFDRTDDHYREGNETEEFILSGKRFMIALCGDLWDAPERFRTESILLWPVYVSYPIEEWEKEEINTYALQAASAADDALMVNCIDPMWDCHGGSFVFHKGDVISRIGFDEEAILYYEI